MTLATVAICTDPLEAHILMGRLEADGIPTFLSSEYHVSLQWHLSLALGGVRISVPETVESEALSVLRRLETTTMYEVALEQEVGVFESRSCPNCGSQLTSATQGRLALTMFYAFLLAFPVPFTHHRHKCNSCGKAFTDTSARSPSLLVRGTIILLLLISLVLGSEMWRDWCAKYCHEQYAVQYAWK